MDGEWWIVARCARHWISIRVDRGLLVVFLYEAHLRAPIEVGRVVPWCARRVVTVDVVGALWRGDGDAIEVRRDPADEVGASGPSLRNRPARREPDVGRQDLGARDRLTLRAGDPAREGCSRRWLDRDSGDVRAAAHDVHRRRCLSVDDEAAWAVVADDVVGD